MKIVWILTLLTMAAVLYGCGPSQVSSGDSPVVSSAEPKGPEATVIPSTKSQDLASTAVPIPKQPLLPIQGITTPMAPALTTPYQADLQNLLEIAADDLARKLSIPKTEIAVKAVFDVIWPDAGLGCSQSGMASAQVLTPGYLIMLQHNNMSYEYHADKGTYVTYCKNPSAPLVLPDQ